MKFAAAVLGFACVLGGAMPALGDALEGKPGPGEILQSAAPAQWRALDPEELLVIELERGKVTIALSRHLAARHVDRIKQVAREGFYDGTSFYRVIDGFVAQGGDPFGERGTAQPADLPAQFDEVVGAGFDFTPLPERDGYAPQVGFAGSMPVGFDAATKRAWHLHCTGALAFGRENERQSESTEMYITLQPQRYLDRNLTVFGYVVDGMEHIQRLRRVSPPNTKSDDLGEMIVSMKIAADLPIVDQPQLEILRSDGPAFAAYVAARRNRPEAFFYHRPDYLDICALQVPVRAQQGQAD